MSNEKPSTDLDFFVRSQGHDYKETYLLAMIEQWIGFDKFWGYDGEDWHQNPNDPHGEDWVIYAEDIFKWRGAILNEFMDRSSDYIYDMPDYMLTAWAARNVEFIDKVLDQDYPWKKVMDAWQSDHLPAKTEDLTLRALIKSAFEKSLFAEFCNYIESSFNRTALKIGKINWEKIDYSDPADYENEFVPGRDAFGPGD